MNTRPPPPPRSPQSHPVDQECPLVRRLQNDWFCMSTVDASDYRRLRFGCPPYCVPRETAKLILQWDHLA
jgi:hypothetical protein